jgi:hypothetical protein
MSAVRDAVCIRNSLFTCSLGPLRRPLVFCGIKKERKASTAADNAAVSVVAATAALAKQTPEMSLNTPVLFWGIRRSSSNGKGITPNFFLKGLDGRGPPLLRPVLPPWRGRSVVEGHAVHVRQPWRIGTNQEL